MNKQYYVMQGCTRTFHAWNAKSKKWERGDDQAKKPIKYPLKWLIEDLKQQK